MADHTQTDVRPTAAGRQRRAGPGAPRPAAVRPLSGARRARHTGLARTAWTVTAVYAVSTAVHLAILAAMTAPHGPSVRERLLAWDALLYISIAEDGYPAGFTYQENGELSGNNLAFFPLFPLLARSLHRLTGVDTGTAALVVAHLSLLAALFAVHRLLIRLYGPRTATVAVVLLAGAQPMALTFLMAYSEALFLALAAGSLLAAHRRAWLTAGVIALLAGLTRPAAFALVLALVCAALLEIRRVGRPAWRPVTAVVLACAGTPAYLAWVGNRSGQLNAWFEIQEAGWGTHWDFGASFVDFLGGAFLRNDDWVPLSTAVLLLAAVFATVLAWRRDAWPPLLVYGTTVLVLTLGQSNFYHSKLRLLIPAVLFLVPLAQSLARSRDRSVVAVLTAATLFGSWYGAHMLTTWRYAI
ncbi:glycosyltransferase 87 family protein [Streptomyces sp. NPDC014894]|uniref:glycosyltransferase 87 family protein n=1 Tax=Streptomyces sp. NPDC014894 TaxID=3364931 RepID=UPI0036F8CDB5